MSRDTTREVAGKIVLSGLFDATCVEDVLDLVKALPDILTPVFSRDITNVIFSVTEPSNTDRSALWIRQDTAGNITGIYVYTGGKWVSVIDRTVYEWSPALTASGSMGINKTATVAKYMLVNGKFEFDVQIDFTTAGAASDTLYINLPSDYTTAQFFTASATVVDGGNTGAYSFPSGTPGLIAIKKSDNTVFGIGAGKRVSVSGHAYIV